MGTSLANIAGNNLPALETEHETAVAAASSQAKAATEARYMMAMHRPRNIETVRVKLLEACKRPGFAATAKYSKPIGKGRVVGPSIRFAEEAARCLTNILVETPTLFDSPEKRVIRVLVTDLETNLSYSGDISLEKVVERKTLKQGQSAIRQRVNSQGEITFTVEATEDDLLVKQQAIASKHMRTGILRVLPGDILEEAMETVAATLKDADAKDPAAARRKVVDAFHEIGVSPTNLVDYLGNPLEQMNPSQLMELRTIYAALKDGETNWAALMEMKGGEGNGFTNKGGAALKDRVAKATGKNGTEAEAEAVTA
jgi:hypothetical protein